MLNVAGAETTVEAGAEVGRSVAETEEGTADPATDDVGLLVLLPLLALLPDSAARTKGAMGGPGKTYTKPGLYTYAHGCHEIVSRKRRGVILKSRRYHIHRA